MLLHKLIDEFRDEVFWGENRALPINLPTQTDGIIVLDYFDHNGKESVEIKATNWENIARVTFAAKVWRSIVQRIPDNPAPWFCPNGLRVALPYLEQMAILADIPHAKIHLMNNGEIGRGNSLTQFELIRNDPILGNAAHITIVSSGYHVPRLERIAAKLLPQTMRYTILGVPRSRFSYDTGKMIRGEIARIIFYIMKGDIATHPRKQCPAVVTRTKEKP